VATGETDHAKRDPQGKLSVRRERVKRGEEEWRSGGVEEWRVDGGE